MLPSLLFSPDVVVVSDLNKNIGGWTDLDLAKKGTEWQICIPLLQTIGAVRHIDDIINYFY